MKSIIARTVTAVLFLLTLSGCGPSGEPPTPPARLSENARALVTDAMSGLRNPVILHLYEGGKGETAGRETRVLLEFMAESSQLATLSLHSLAEGIPSPVSGSFPEVAHGPVIVIEGTADRRPFLFCGFPERKELKPFLDGVLIASGVPASLPAEVEEYLAGLQTDVLIRIFTTPD